ncbi:MAG: WxcM-like domain-containing protein [Oceanospirillaceae bacterium]|nr:WxcM-like domain-containing protein [Oceanospirillaceae bacterium]
MSIIRWLEFPKLDDSRGCLVALEGNKTVPFDIKRVYYIFKTQEKVSRGFHAHKDLTQIAVCISGKCRMILDDGKSREDVWLDNPNKGLLIESMVWREIHDFSIDCILLVLASEHYNETDYIRDYSKFLEYM